MGRLLYQPIGSAAIFTCVLWLLSGARLFRWLLRASAGRCHTAAGWLLNVVIAVDRLRERGIIQLLPFLVGDGWAGIQFGFGLVYRHLRVVQKSARRSHVQGLQWCHGVTATAYVNCGKSFARFGIHVDFADIADFLPGGILDVCAYEIF